MTDDSYYKDYILDHYQNPRNYGELDRPDFESLENNPLCGDMIKMQIKITNSKQQVPNKLQFPKSKIQKIMFSGSGCAISMASASMLTEKVKGMSVEEAMKINKEDIVKMLGIQLSPVRLKCALLPLQALHSAVQNMESGS